MHASWVINLLAWMSLVLVPQLAATTVRLAIVHGQGAPVVQLALRVEDAEGQPFDLRTDADGQTVAGPLGGPVCFIRTAMLADGTALQVEPTTARDGLRLGLIPGHERTVRLIAEGGLLFLDPNASRPRPRCQPSPCSRSRPTRTASTAR